MDRTLRFVFLLSFVSTLASAQVPEGHRYINLTADADKATQHIYRYKWYQAESLTKDVSFSEAGEAVVPDGTRRVEWIMTDRNDAGDVYFSQTGTIHDAGWRFTFSPSNTTFSPKTYAGYIRSYMTNAQGVVTQNLLVAREGLTVLSSPGWEQTPVIGPLTSTNWIQRPDEWPAGWVLTTSNNGDTVYAIEAPQGGSGSGGISPSDFVDTATITWTKTGGQIRATATVEGGSGSKLTVAGNTIAELEIGEGLTATGGVLSSVQPDLSSYAVIGGSASPGDIPVYNAAPYEHGIWTTPQPWTDAEIPAPDEAGEVLHYTGSGYAWSQIYSYYQPAVETNVVIGTNRADFAYTGITNTFVVPPGVSNLQVKMWGAAGGSSDDRPGGTGGFTVGYLMVTPLETLFVVVGEGGKNGGTSRTFGEGGRMGGSGNRGGSGGGMSALFRGTNVLAVAGGGGGSGTDGSTSTPHGGGLEGKTPGAGATGGSQTAGGTSGGGYLHGASATGQYDGGGGGGYYGGGYDGNGGRDAGGGGSGYIGGLLFANTYQGTFSAYESEYPGGSVGANSGSYQDGGNGYIILKW